MKFSQKYWELAILKNSVFLSRPICFFFQIFFCFIPMKTSQSLMVSRDGSKFWSSFQNQFFCWKVTVHMDWQCPRAFTIYKTRCWPALYLVLQKGPKPSSKYSHILKTRLATTQHLWRPLSNIIVMCSNVKIYRIVWFNWT